MKSPSIAPSIPDLTFTKGKDPLTRHGAGVLCEHIEMWWRSRGYPGVIAERYEIPGMEGKYGVRSNLVNGWPVVRVGGAAVSS